MEGILFKLNKKVQYFTLKLLQSWPRFFLKVRWNKN